MHINRCPILVTAKMADPATAERLGISGESVRATPGRIARASRPRRRRRLAEDAGRLRAAASYDAITDPDRMLYGGGFFSAKDKRVMEQVRATEPEELAAAVFRVRGPALTGNVVPLSGPQLSQTLSAEERSLWEEYRFARLTEPEAGASICMEEFQTLIEHLLASVRVSRRKTGRCWSSCWTTATACWPDSGAIFFGITHMGRPAAALIMAAR